MTVRAKFIVEEVKRTRWNMASEGAGELKVEQIKMTAQYDDGLDKENASFAKATPTGTIEFTLNNPHVQGFFEPGDVFLLDFNKVPNPAKAA